MLIQFLASSAYVPYDPSVFSQFWRNIMTTIASASGVGILIFSVLSCIGIFKLVLNFWL